MERRDFLIRGSLTASGVMFLNSIPSFARASFDEGAEHKADSLYQLFKDPAAQYRPYVRWWWNGDKIEKDKLARELRILIDGQGNQLARNVVDAIENGLIKDTYTLGRSAEQRPMLVYFRL